MPFDTFSASPARHELAVLNAQFAEAAAARDEAQRAHDRLDQPARLLVEVSTEYAGEKALHDAAIVAWYEGGCPGARPDTPARLLELERRLGDLRRDGVASENARETAARALQAAIEDLAQISTRQQSALYGAAVEDARESLHARAVPALVTLLNEFASIATLAAELRSGAHGAEGMLASRQIYRLLSTARQSIGVRGDPGPAKAFLIELANNPEATLPSPGEPVIEHSELPTEQPPVDGRQFINRGPPEEAPRPAAEFHPNPATDPDAAWRHWHANPIGGSPLTPTPPSGS
jgi:hypothetical protein